MRFFLVLVWLLMTCQVSISQEESLEDIFDEGEYAHTQLSLGADVLRVIGGTPHIQFSAEKDKSAYLLNIEGGVIPFGYLINLNSPVFYNRQVRFGREFSTSLLFRVFEYKYNGAIFGDVRFYVGAGFENWRYSTQNMEVSTLMMDLFIDGENGRMLNNEFLFKVQDNYDFTFDRKINLISLIFGVEQGFANRDAYGVHAHFGFTQNQIRVNHSKTTGVEWNGSRPTAWHQPSFISYHVNFRISITYKFNIKK